MKVIVLDDPNLEQRLASLAQAHNTNDDEMISRVLNDYFRVPSFEDTEQEQPQELVAAL